MKQINYTIIVFFISVYCFSQDQNKNVEFFPSILHFKPLLANYQEPRFGFTFVPNTKIVNVTFGTSFDVVKFMFDNSNISGGLEMGGLVLFLRSKDYSVNVDNIDALYGFNIIYSINTKNKISLRFRLIHNSSHLIDEHFAEDNNLNDLNNEAINISQEFIETTIAQSFEYTNSVLRYYANLGYIIHLNQAVYPRFFGNLGVEYSFKDLFRVFNQLESNLFFASNIRISPNPKYRTSFNNTIGLKFGNWYGRGVVIHLSYYFGNSFYNEYYKERISQFGIGFYVDLF